MSGSDPPAGWRRLLAQLAPVADRGEVLSDLDELYRLRVERDGDSHAARWYRRQVRAFAVARMLGRWKHLGGTKASVSRVQSGLMDQLLQDLKFSIRALVARPGFTIVAVLTLGLGIGATAAIFTVVRSVLLRPLPYSQPDRLVKVWNPWTNEPGVSRGRSPVADVEIVEARTAVSSFENVAAYARLTDASLTGSNEPERVALTRASSELFTVLGAPAQIGRTFSAEEDAPSRNDVVVLSHALWQRRFGGHASILNTTIGLDGAPHRVIGVMPPEFRMPEDYLGGAATEVWKPLGLDPGVLDRGNLWLYAVARLRADATLARANAELESLTRSWIEQRFKIPDLLPYYAEPLTEELFSSVRPALLMLFGAVAFVLLIACVNVAILLLVRADGRRTEMAVRAALGAARSRIVSQLLTESMVLAVVGGVIGIVLALLGVRLLVALEPASIPRVEEIRLDAAALSFTAFVTVFTALIFGLVPALQAARTALSQELRTGTRTLAGGRRQQRFRGGLVSAEIALSVILVIGASLMIRTFMELSRIDAGFDSERVLTFAIPLPRDAYAEPESRARFNGLLVDRLDRIAGVEAVGAARYLPLTGRLGGGTVEIEHATPLPGAPPPNARWQIVTPGYFAALRYNLQDGRALESTDRAGAAPVVVVNRTFADMFWPNESAIGRRVRNTNTDVPWFSVVGVVQDVRHSGLVDTPSPTIYFPLDQMALTRSFTPTTMMYAVRTSSNPIALVGAVRDAVRSLDASVPLADVRTMDDISDDALAQPRFTMLVLGIFAGLALALAAIGIYGLLSYTVSQQRREIGVRVALGAPMAIVLGFVVWKGMRLALFGLTVGLIASLLLAGFLERLLYGVQPLDPATFVLVPVLFVLLALGATYLPARSASRVNPMFALRHD